MILKVGDRVCTVYGVEVVITEIRDNEVVALPATDVNLILEDILKLQRNREVDNAGGDKG